MASERRTKYWLALQQVFGAGDSRINDIVDKYGTAIDFFRAGKEGWKEIDGILPQHIEKLANLDVPGIEKVVADCRKVGCHIVTPEDGEYPESLRHIYAMPAVLYVLGNLNCLKNRLAIAMVGTRTCSSAGLNIAFQIARELGQMDAVVVSGMARGIDTSCHKGVLEGGGTTVALLSCGLDQVYPPENIALWEEICRKGAVVSEYPPGTEITRRSFYVRNRLISGMSRGVVMVEGSSHSGTSITVTHGLEQGKEIFVVPGNPNTPAGMWAVELLRQGAIPVASGAHILEEYGYGELKRSPESEEERQERRENLQETMRQNKPHKEKSEKKEKKAVPDTEESEHPKEERQIPELEGTLKLIYELLDEDGQYGDVLCQCSGFDISTVTVALTQLEMLGLAEAMPGGRYRKI